MKIIIIGKMNNLEIMKNNKRAIRLIMGIKMCGKPCHSKEKVIVRLKRLVTIFF